MNAWAFTAPEDDRRAILSGLQAVLSELGTLNAEVHMPTFWRSVDEVSWLRAGMSVGAERTLEIFDRILENRDFECLFSLDDGSIVSPYWDQSFVVSTTSALHRARSLAEGLRLEVDQIDWQAPEVTSYQPAGYELAQRVQRFTFPGSGAYLLEKSAGGYFGLRARSLNSATSEGIMDRLRARSLVAVFENVDLRSFQCMDEALFDDLCAVPDSSSEIRYPLAIFPTVDDQGWVEASFAWSWPEVLERRGITDVSEVRFMPAMCWYQEPGPFYFAVPDHDGVVRAMGEF